MMGKFGLENGSVELVKWRFKLILSCHKSHYLNACTAAKKLVQGGCLFSSRRGRVPGYLVLWSWSELVSAVSPPCPGSLRTRGCCTGLCACCQLSPVSPGDPATSSFIPVSLQEEASRYLPYPYLTKEDPHIQKLP